MFSLFIKLQLEKSLFMGAAGIDSCITALTCDQALPLSLITCIFSFLSLSLPFPGKETPDRRYNSTCLSYYSFPDFEGAKILRNVQVYTLAFLNLSFAVVTIFELRNLNMSFSGK